MVIAKVPKTVYKIFRNDRFCCSIDAELYDVQEVQERVEAQRGT